MSNAKRDDRMEAQLGVIRYTTFGGINYVTVADSVALLMNERGANDEKVKRLVECLKDYDAWATANEHELECRADDDCDHCVLMQFREEARKVVREHESGGAG